MPGDCDNELDKIDKNDAIPIPSQQWRAATELDRFDLGTSDGNAYEGDNGDKENADKEEEASQADDGLKQTLEDWGYSTREREHSTVYFRPVKYDNGEGDATASDVYEVHTVSYHVTSSQSWIYMAESGIG
jgi:hypothetical protein